MNKRIRRKKLASIDRAIIDALRLYQTRPSGEKWKELAEGLVGLNLGLALHFRLQLLPGPRRGWGVGPPRNLAVLERAVDFISARGECEYYPPGDKPGVVEALHFTARRAAGDRWSLAIVTTSLAAG